MSSARQELVNSTLCDGRHRIRTSGLHLLRADVDELLYLFGRDIFPGPCIFPPGLWLCDWLVHICILGRLGAGTRPVFGPEDVLEEGHVERSGGGWLTLGCAASAAGTVDRSAVFAGAREG